LHMIFTINSDYSPK